MRAWRILRRWPDTAETSLSFLRAIARHPRSSDSFAQDSVNLATYLPLQLAYRGRLHEAYLAVGNRPGRLFSQLAILGAIDPDTASAVFAEWLAAGRPETRSALPWWAGRGDTASIVAFLRLHRAQSAKAKAERRAYDEYDSQAGQAYLYSPATIPPVRLGVRVAVGYPLPSLRPAHLTTALLLFRTEVRGSRQVLGSVCIPI